MKINRINNNINFNGRINVFSINPSTGLIETKMVDTTSIKAIKTSMLNGEQVNSLIYRTPNGVKKCVSLNVFPNFTEDKLKAYIRKQVLNADKSGNLVDVLL